MAPPRQLEEYIFKGVLAVAGMSIGVNSFLVKDKVGEMTASLRAVEAAVRSLELSTAVAQQQQNALAVRQDQAEARDEKQAERLRYLEEAFSQMRARIR